MAHFTVGRRRIIVLLLLTSVLLLTLDLRGNALFDRARDGFSMVLSPFETAAGVVTRPAVNAWRAITEYDELVEENRELRQQLDAQRGAEIAARNAIIEHQQLLDLHDLESLADYPTVTASVIGPMPSNVDQVVEINVGYNNTGAEIQTGMPVVTQGGLVGKITRVGPTTSQVMLVTDPRYWIGVKVLSEVTPTPPVAPSGTTPSGLDPDELTAITDPDGEPGETGDEPGGDEPDPTDTAGDADPGETGVGEGEDPAEAEAGDVDGGDGDGDGDEGDGSGLLDGLDGLGDGPVTATTEPPVLVERETGALQGHGRNRLPMVTFLSTDSVLGHISVGDTIVTSGGTATGSESLAPPDIPVGMVRNVIPPRGSGGTELEVELSADLSSLYYVRVVLYRPLSEMAQTVE